MGVENVVIVDCISELLEKGTCIAGALTGQQPSTDTDTFSWRLCTKYYDVDLVVWVTSISALIEPTLQLSETRAVLFYWDGLDSRCFQSCWNSLSNRESIAVRLLVCDYDVSMEVRQFTLHWCIENEFEIVILQPSDDLIQEAAENCEKIGLDRIVEALQVFRSRHYSVLNCNFQAHQWTNLVKKDAGNYSQCVDGERCLGEGLESQAANSDEEKSSSTSFTDLYEQFSSVVAHSKTLSGDQRKEYAAQMVTKFWKSMKVSGCSSLSDLSDGSDIA